MNSRIIGNVPIVGILDASRNQVSDHLSIDSYKNAASYALVAGGVMGFLWLCRKGAGFLPRGIAAGHEIVRWGTPNVPEQFVRLSRLSISFQLEEIKEASRVSVGLLRNYLQLIPGSLTDRYALESAITEFWYGCRTDQSHFRFIGLNKLRPLSNVASWMANLEYLMVADAALIGAAVGDESLLQNVRWLIEHVLQQEEGSLFVSSEPVEIKIDRARKLANDRLLPTHADKFRLRYSHITDEEIFNRVQILHEIVSTIRDLIRHETLGPALFALDASLPDERSLGPLSRT